jgi:hypothetical protein
VREQINGTPVNLLGVLHGEQVDDALRRTTVGLVTQRPGLTEFNLPSRMMHFFLRGVPIVARVGADSETARLVRASGAGWVVESEQAEKLPDTIRAVLADRDEVERRARKAYEFAVEHFAQDRVTDAFEGLLTEAAGTRPRS